MTWARNWSRDRRLDTDTERVVTVEVHASRILDALTDMEAAIGRVEGDHLFLGGKGFVVSGTYVTGGGGGWFDVAIVFKRAARAPAGVFG